jgi:acetyltransferase-like isoleucine patch superfamily enzyme
VVARLRHAVRRARARTFYAARGVHHGPSPYIRGLLPSIDARGDVRAGSHFVVHGTQHRVRLGAAPGARLSVGDHVFVNRGSTVYATVSIELGDHTRLGDFVSIHDSDFHAVEEGAPVRRAPVVVGRNVWIGRHAIVMPGVTIGDHSVVAAGSVVTRDVPERSVVAGNPAEVKRRIAASDQWVRD